MKTMGTGLEDGGSQGPLSGTALVRRGSPHVHRTERHILSALGRSKFQDLGARYCRLWSGWGLETGYRPFPLCSKVARFWEPITACELVTIGPYVPGELVND